MSIKTVQHMLYHTILPQSLRHMYLTPRITRACWNIALINLNFLKMHKPFGKKHNKSLFWIPDLPLSLKKLKLKRIQSLINSENSWLVFCFCFILQLITNNLNTES